MRHLSDSVVVLVGIFCFITNCFFAGELRNVLIAAKYPLFDFSGQWTLCAYALSGVDPYPLIGVKTPFIEEIGTIPLVWSTSPWGLLLGNFFYPGFLESGDAVIYFIILNSFFFPVTADLLARKLNLGLRRLTVFFLTVTAFCGNFFISAYFGNAGAVICCLMILVYLYADERPIAAGFMLALAMVKPQVALPLCFALLLRKNFKVLLTAAAVDFAAWGIAALMTNKMPQVLLTEFLSLDTGGHTVFSGLFTLIFPDEKWLAMLTSMLAGILFIWLTFKDEKNFWACPAFLATTFFAYSFHNEFFALTIPALICLQIAARAENSPEKIFWLGAVIFMASAPYALLLLLEIFVGDVTRSFWIDRTIFAVVMILLGFMMKKKFLNVTP